VIRVYSEQKESRECVIRVTGVSRVIESDSDSESSAGFSDSREIRE